ncbi:MAG TPA: hypothetical protein VK463_07680 [Desulfomonilaceae bacterium]|nr:hypothetical protein [Desulfomonilaceae bacterium]
MNKRNIIAEGTRAHEFVQDVKAGMNDAALQTKYGLSSKKFYFYKATAMDIIAKQQQENAKSRRKISAKKVLGDIRSGMEDDQLMTKYDLSPRQLQTVLRQIINAGLATPMEMSGRLSITKSQVREAFVEMGKAIRELD